MIITCPSCQARYPVDAAAFAPSGRKVRCKKCGHVWHQLPQEGDAPPVASRAATQADLGLPTQLAAEQKPKPAPTPKPEAAKPESKVATPVASPEPVPEQPPVPSFTFETAAPGEPPAFEQAAKASEKKRRGLDLGASAKEVPIVMAEIPDTQLGMGGKLRNFVHDAAHIRRSRFTNILGWFLLALFVGSTVFAGYYFYPWITSAVPKTSKLYEAAGKPINLRGLEFQEVTYERQTENGLPVLAIKGKIFNMTSETRALPPLRVALSDGAQVELYHWTFSLPEKEVEPGKSVDFVTRLSSPPAEARDLEVRFVLKDEELGSTPPPVAPEATPADSIPTPPVSVPSPEPAPASGGDGGHSAL